ncbi:hypothetical protein MKW94_006740 [Papaver nudicaule]|uniref:Protein NRT1/ PTR FAMILY 5.10-like n=1 Tax=Papaver nudicaule TaxID=74823 RepID=A0AA41S7R0_PAPNU|nr:hypothetical protein [Papaver nudicaule]
MAASAVVDESSEPLLLKNNVFRGDGSKSEDGAEVEGVVNYRGEKIMDRSRYGGWKCASLLIVVEICEMFAFYGIASNLITYLTGPLHQSTTTSAEYINVWHGVVMMLPVLGAFVADFFLGRFCTILFCSLIYILGLGLLTLSATVPSLGQPVSSTKYTDIPSSNSSSFQLLFFFFSLYLVALGRAGYKPCTEAFGANQFDGRNPQECKSLSSFFNWWALGLCLGSAISNLTLNYVQESLSWTLGFGIPCISMAVALVIFLLGTKSYRYSVKENKENPLMSTARVFTLAAKNWRSHSSPPLVSIEEAEIGIPNHVSAGGHQFRFLDKALIMSNDGGTSKPGTSCSISQVDDAKALLRIVPIWFTCLIYAVVSAQSSTFFTKQGNTMERSVGSLSIPAASLQIFTSLSIVFFIVMYDRLFVPLARAFTGKPNGITMLQRIGTGMFLSTLAMVVAAVVEKKRLQTALDSGLINMPKATIPMSIWWLVPQYILFGLADTFTMVGLQEFFYDQVPGGLRSIGISLFSTIFGIGNFLSGFLIFVIQKVTSRNGQQSWFSDNLNCAHLDYFYGLLAALSATQMVAYLCFSKAYIYRRGTSMGY